MTKTITFISLFRHQSGDRRYISGVFTGADGESRTAFGFPGLKQALGGVALKAKTDSRGIPYAATPVPVCVEYSPYGDGLADIMSIQARPADTDTLGLLDSVLGGAQAAQPSQPATPPPAVA